DGSATFTIETSRIVMKKAVATTARTLQRWGSEAMVQPPAGIGRRSRSNERPVPGYSARRSKGRGLTPAGVRPQPLFKALDLAELLKRERAREAREVVELRRQERVLVVDLEVGEELLRRGFVLGELPDPPAAHHVLVAHPPVRAFRDWPDPQIVRKRQPFVLRR